jgi:HPt (histidine-containing phosphotransfer) domain-containing protein
MTPAEMKAVYLARLPFLLAEVRQCAADLAEPGSGAHARLGAVAHRIKGSAGTFGLPEVGATAAALELAPAQGLPLACAELVAAIESALAAASGLFRIAVAVSEPELAQVLVDRLADASRTFETALAFEALESSLAKGEIALAIVDRPSGSPLLTAALGRLAEAAASSGATVLLLDREAQRPPTCLPRETQRLAWPDVAPTLEAVAAGSLQSFAMHRAAPHSGRGAGGTG